MDSEKSFKHRFWKEPEFAVWSTGDSDRLSKYLFYDDFAFPHWLFLHDYEWDDWEECFWLPWITKMRDCLQTENKSIQDDIEQLRQLRNEESKFERYISIFRSEPYVRAMKDLKTRWEKKYDELENPSMKLYLSLVKNVALTDEQCYGCCVFCFERKEKTLSALQNTLQSVMENGSLLKELEITKTELSDLLSEVMSVTEVYKKEQETQKTAKRAMFGLFWLECDEMVDRCDNLCEDLHVSDLSAKLHRLAMKIEKAKSCTKAGKNIKWRVPDLKKMLLQKNLINRQSYRGKSLACRGILLTSLRFEGLYEVMISCVGAPRVVIRTVNNLLPSITCKKVKVKLSNVFGIERMKKILWGKKKMKQILWKNDNRKVIQIMSSYRKVPGKYMWISCVNMLSICVILFALHEYIETDHGHYKTRASLFRVEDLKCNALLHIESVKQHDGSMKHLFGTVFFIKGWCLTRANTFPLETIPYKQSGIDCDDFRSSLYKSDHAIQRLQRPIRSQTFTKISRSAREMSSDDSSDQFVDHDVKANAYDQLEVQDVFLDFSLKHVTSGRKNYKTDKQALKPTVYENLKECSMERMPVTVCIQKRRVLKRANVYFLETKLYTFPFVDHDEYKSFQNKTDQPQQLRHSQTFKTKSCFVQEMISDDSSYKLNNDDMQTEAKYHPRVQGSRASKAASFLRHRWKTVCQGLLLIVLCVWLCYVVIKANIGSDHVKKSNRKLDANTVIVRRLSGILALRRGKGRDSNWSHKDLMKIKTKDIEEASNSTTARRRLQYVVQSETPHEVDVNEDLNIVSLRSKPTVSNRILQFLSEFCSLRNHRNVNTARQFSIREMEKEISNKRDLTEIELSGEEVTDSVHRDSKAEDNMLENSSIEIGTAFNRVLNNIKWLDSPQLSSESHMEDTVVMPNNSGRMDILYNEQKARMTNKQRNLQPQLELEGISVLQETHVKLSSKSDAKLQEKQFKELKYQLVISGSKQKEIEDDKRYSKPSTLRKLWPAPVDETGKIIRRLTEIPQPQIDAKFARQLLEVFMAFEPLMIIVDQIALGRPPAPHVSMRYELLRFCTLRSYPKEDKPYLIKLAEAGFYYASDGDGVVCYCCGIRRYNWTADDQPMKIHKRINPTCKFLIKNEEVNVRNNYNGPFSKELMAIDSIPELVESQEPSEDINNDWAPERTRSPASRSQNNESTGSSNQLGINTAIPKHSQYAAKPSRLASFSGWPDTASHTPDVLADAGFFYAGFGDCVRCFYCGIGLRHWTQDDNPWIEHARWAKNCVFVKQKKGEEFVNLVQLAVQYSQDNAPEENSGGNQLSPQEIENILLSDAAQSVLDMGYQPRIIKKAVEQIIRQNRQAKITAQFLMEKILEIEEGKNETPGSLVSPGAATSTVGATGTTEGATGSSLNESLKKSAEPEKKHKGGKPEDKKSTHIKEKNDKEKIITKANKDVSKDKASYDPSSQQDPKAIKAENEQLKEQTICKICLDQTVSIVFLPCGHLVTCADCAPAMRKCPICRALVKGTVRTYMS